MPNVTVEAAGETTVVEYGSTRGALPLGAARYPLPDGWVEVRPGELVAAINAAPAGATLALRAGTYNGTADIGVVIKRGLTIMNYPGEAVTIDGMGTKQWLFVVKAAKFAMLGIRVRNFSLLSTATYEYGIMLPSGSDNFLFENCIFENFRGAQPRVGYAPVFPFNQTGGMVRNNTFQNNEHLHFNTNQTTNLTITRNKFLNCNTSGQIMAPVTSAMKHTRAKGIVITENDFDGCPGCSAIWFDANCWQMTVEDNDIRNVGMEGIQFETSGYGSAKRNKIRGASNYGIRVFDSNDILLEENDIDGPILWHIGVMQDARRAVDDPNAGYTPPGITWASYNIQFVNNKLGPNGGIYQMQVFDDRTNLPAEQMVSEVSGNILATPLKGKQIAWGRADNKTREIVTPEQLNARYPAVARNNT